MFGTLSFAGRGRLETRLELSLVPHIKDTVGLPPKELNNLSGPSFLAVGYSYMF